MLQSITINSLLQTTIRIQQVGMVMEEEEELGSNNRMELVTLHPTQLHLPIQTNRITTPMSLDLQGKEELQIVQIQPMAMVV